MEFDIEFSEERFHEIFPPEGLWLFIHGHKKTRITTRYQISIPKKVRENTEVQLPDAPLKILRVYKQPCAATTRFMWSKKIFEEIKRQFLKESR